MTENNENVQGIEVDGVIIDEVAEIAQTQEQVDDAVTKGIAELGAMSEALDSLRVGRSSNRLLTPEERRQRKEALDQQEAAKAKRRAAGKKAAASRKRNRS